MLEFMGTAVLSFIEKELVKAEPELEALVIAQLEKLGAAIMAFVNSKLEAAPTAPVVESPAPVADDSAAS